MCLTEPATTLLAVLSGFLKSGVRKSPRIALCAPAVVMHRAAVTYLRCAFGQRRAFWHFSELVAQVAHLKGRLKKAKWLQHCALLDLFPRSQRGHQRARLENRRLRTLHCAYPLSADNSVQWSEPNCVPTETESVPTLPRKRGRAGHKFGGNADHGMKGAMPHEKLCRVAVRTRCGSWIFCSTTRHSFGLIYRLFRNFKTGSSGR